jgi:hypothetical protein
LPAYVLTVLLSFWTRIIIGISLIAIGLAMAVMARRSFVQAGTNVEPWKPSLTLVTGGVFAWMRNPMYVGLTLLLAGLAIALASDWTLVLPVPAALVLHFGVVRREEQTPLRQWLILPQREETGQWAISRGLEWSSIRRPCSTRSGKFVVDLRASSGGVR